MNRTTGPSSIIYLLLSGFAVFAVSLAFSGSVFARDFHDPPLSFLFGNHIDTHQENVLTTDRSGNPKSLVGFFYIIYTGDTDPVSGLPIARHPRGLMLDSNGNVAHDERCGITVNCVVGWTMIGKPGVTKFLYHNGVNGDDHPVWLVNRTDETTAEGLVSGIPQPGSYTHFHWISRDSNDPRASTVSDACDKDDAAQLQDTAPSAVNKLCQGWFLQLIAVKNFALEHGGEIIPVRLGVDNRSHLNILTNYKPLPDGTITPTR